jgi:hypothetical protein
MQKLTRLAPSRSAVTNPIAMANSCPMVRLSVLLSALFVATTVRAAPRPVVLELFTSQSCSSCPPADALLADLAVSQTDVLPLDFHVDYWNYLSWRDRFSLPAATARQRAYAAALGAEVYTPQMVIDGTAQVVGSNRAAVTAALAHARAAMTKQAPGTSPTLTLTDRGGRLALDVGAGATGATLLLLGFDPMHVTQVGAGENAGRTLTEVNVVRSIKQLPAWNGAATSLLFDKPAGARTAVLLQAADGRILAAASL